MPEKPHNHLKDEKSPYLRQHSGNPVEWYPWGEEAFGRARADDKPVFLSIGYATCHWCHVMAHESFEDPEVASLMNEAFVNIKVDREERPDIDHTYMMVCQLTGGQGGWPLNVILTPEKDPFYATTYVPRRGRGGRPGMLELVPWIAGLWKNEREKVTDSARNLVEAYRSTTRYRSSSVDYGEIPDRAWRQFRQQYDREFGGFGSAPKFPSPHNLMFLLRYGRRTGEKEALEMVTRTLTMMRRGGIWDHVGFGFHRYSTDRSWEVPHFEKMLYDQGLMMMAYAEAWQVTGRSLFRETVLQIAIWLEERLQSKTGAFWSAVDADSSEGEGVFYSWTAGEIRELLTEEDAALAMEWYSMKEEGNYRDEATGERTGRNLPHLTGDAARLAEGMGKQSDEMAEQIERIRSTLHRARDRREHPATDRKILTDWNGLTVAALAKAGNILGEDRLTEAARTAAEWILKEMKHDGHRLWHRNVDGERSVLGNADDYAYLIWGLLELYEATFDFRYLEEAIGFQKQFDEEFLDREMGGYYFTSSDEEVILERSRELYDGAMPSANSVAILNLLRLGRLTGNEERETEAERTIGLYGEQVKRAPTGFSHMLRALEFLEADPMEVIMTGEPGASEIERFRRMLGRNFIPHKVVLLYDRPEMQERIPFLKQFPTGDSRPSFHICRNYACRQPVQDAAAALELMKEQKNSS